MFDFNVFTDEIIIYTGIGCDIRHANKKKKEIKAETKTITAHLYCLLEIKLKNGKRVANNKPPYAYITNVSL